MAQNMNQGKPNPMVDSAFEFLEMFGHVQGLFSEEYDGGLLIKISGSFFLVDLKTSKILLTQSLSIEYLGELGDENYAYLDFGLKAGEIINGLKF